MENEYEAKISKVNKKILNKTQKKLRIIEPNFISRKMDQTIAVPKRKQKIKSIKKIISTRKKIQLQKTLVRRKNIEQIFKNVISSHSQSLKPQRKHMHIDLNKKGNMRIPNRLVDTLYRQNIKNYDPYIVTLEQLQQQKQISVFQKQRISNLCHIGAAKLFLKMKKFAVPHTYYRVNMLIRTYMWQQMCELVNYKQQNYDSVIFISITQMALSFNPLKYPGEIDEIMPRSYYSSVIVEVNRIITAEYVRYKLSNIFNFEQSLAGKLILSLMSVICLIFLFNANRFLVPVIFGLFVIWIFYSIYECVNKLNQLVLSKNVTETILRRINEFFQRIRTDQVEWKTGQDFYWLQIHYIKKKKKVQS